ncbi:hypothetical protein WT24_07090 [Burkholderia sp. MSMB1078WGS]|uniref:hypothetical protein n=1 Tax=Burkholderia sp. MSMB1078WGS TaxID=1637900 RepID=UPI000758D34D|nr:hypothetical protein WT24_07090 [Burkholderia sp. MSMB1078WGS]
MFGLTLDLRGGRPRPLMAVGQHARANVARKYVFAARDLQRRPDDNLARPIHIEAAERGHEIRRLHACFLVHQVRFSGQAIAEVESVPIIRSYARRRQHDVNEFLTIGETCTWPAHLARVVNLEFHSGNIASNMGAGIAALHLECPT